jgi:hypothetical protein
MRGIIFLFFSLLSLDTSAEVFLKGCKDIAKDTNLQLENKKLPNSIWIMNKATCSQVNARPILQYSYRLSSSQYNTTKIKEAIRRDHTKLGLQVCDLDLMEIVDHSYIYHDFNGNKIIEELFTYDDCFKNTESLVIQSETPKFREEQADKAKLFIKQMQ